MTPPLSSLLLVGCGKMGRALLDRWQHASGIGHFDVIDPAAAHVPTSRVGWHQKLEALPEDYTPHIIVFAVKPQTLPEILPAYRARFGTAPLYLSIAAGKTTGFFRRHLGRDIRIARAMPNLPALTGHGMTALCAEGLTEADRHLASMLMQAVGRIDWVDEKHMDAVTALSGSGPAYVFLFLDCLAKAGVAAGLDVQTAHHLALETVIGSCDLARHSTDTLEALRKNVTSPGGTTEAALDILMQGNAFGKLIEKAVDAAAKRSRELAE